MTGCKLYDTKQLLTVGAATYMHYNYPPYMQVKSDTLKGYVVYAQDL